MTSDNFVRTISLPALFFLSAFLVTGEVRLRTAELRIADGSEISVDGKTVGNAPCEFSLSTGVRHKIEVKETGGERRTVYFIASDAAKANQVKDIPAWYLNPDLLRPQFPGFEVFAAATATSRTIDVALSKADLDATSRLVQGSTNVYQGNPSSREKRMLDSTRSKSYPRLTRGQMDSLAITNGGKIIVTTSSGTVNRTLLLVEIQKAGTMFRVYVLAGKKK